MTPPLPSCSPLRAKRDHPPLPPAPVPALTSRATQPFRLLAALALTLTFALTSSAQYEIKSGAYNTLYRGTVPSETDNNPPILSTQPQFAGMGVTAASRSAISTSTILTVRYPSQINVVAGTTTPTGVAVLHMRSSFGGAFASGAPRYLFGEYITPPTTDHAGAPLANSATYWRQKPVEPGETFVHPSGSQDAAPKVAAGSILNYYYSIHAEKTFASQSGRVLITWVSRIPVASGTDTSLRYRYRDEIFAVSSVTNKAVRTIFWTETQRGFSGPLVSVPTGNIELVNPIYNALVPATVAQEYQPAGVSTNTNAATAPPSELRTVWFDKAGSEGKLHAHNKEGRMLLEYLGKPKAGANTTFTFLGADILDVVRAAPTVNATVNLGEKITARDGDNRALPLDGSAAWLASPVNTLSPEGTTFYATNTRPDGVVDYYAERENSNPDRVVFYWSEKRDAAIAADATTTPAIPVNLFWPKAKNAYLITWPDSLAAYVHNTVAATGATTGTGVQFSSGRLPQIVFQDDNAQTEGSLDSATGRLVINLPSGGDGLNRTLLKFFSGSEVWYFRVYTQADSRVGYREADGTTTPLALTASVGQRIDPPSAAYATAGYLVAGTGLSDAYDPDAYLDPYTVGVAEAAAGAIIPVNAIPGKTDLKVWWFQRVTPPSAAFAPFYVPSKVARYTVSFPAAPREIILASNAGSGDLSPSEVAGRLYIQNDRTARGFNPNEEHALLLNGRVYALRDDLNVTSPEAALYTSQPHALLKYTSPTDGRPAMSVFKILRENATYHFDYPITAGTIVQAPLPLTLLPLPLDARGDSKNIEVAGAGAGVPDSTHQGPARYTSFTFTDRKGYNWVYRGPHAAATPSFRMQFYYTMREGFYIPGLASQPAPGTILPYLRPIVNNAPDGDPVTGTALAITYRPVWPAGAPSLRIAETLTLNKFGLPDVISQKSAQVLYQQSIATGGTTATSVVLHDPIREKVFPLGGAGQLVTLPDSILTTSSAGKTYFQRLAPHLQPRIYFDPTRGAKGSLVLLGLFVDEVAGDDYLQLNVLSTADQAALAALAADTDLNRPLWLDALTRLTTRVETHVEDPAKAGSFKSDGAPVTVGPTALATVVDSDTSVVKYALTATGAGSGWVTLVFGNGRFFTPKGDPVAVKVFKVAPQLYTGDLKVLPSKNPLDEQVTLRHSGDFAAKPDHYDFEWRYAPPQNGTAPGVYTYTQTSRLGTTWKFAPLPAAALPTDAEYSAAPTYSLQRNVQIRPLLVPAIPAGTGTVLPGLVVRSADGVDFSAGVPAQIVFSATIADLTGFVLYVNGVPALAFQAPVAFAAFNVNASSGLTAGGLARQFSVDSNFFQQNVNRLEVAVYTTADVGVSSDLDFRLHASTESDQVVAVGSPWQTPNGTLTNEAIVGGSPTAPLGSPLLVMSDNYFTMRYRPKAASPAAGIPANVAGSIAWSRWMPPKLVEGWIKRVLAGINPFNQRLGDLSNNAVSTDVSVLTQAGKRWEGDIALSLDSINNFGLIEIYETVLNRGKKMSIDSGFDYGAANDALLLAAGYLNDLYTLLGNEAYADAANPTISLDDSTTVTEVNTARFSFEGQVSTVLDEELALLRGRDDFLMPGVTVSPAYNRLYWNYTRGILSGEALYAVNYSIREKAGSATANGTLDAADAQAMFPQGHGDAYGHYLTALTNYYRLLTNAHFTWTPRAETVTVLGQAVQVDYYDERKFADAASNLARTAQQIVTLTHRQSYRDDPAAGWANFRDGKVNSTTGVIRQWGLDEWSSRSAQGAYYHWIVANALLPDKDNDPNHTGVQVIDRTTVASLKELPAVGESFQSTMDSANVHLNPLGLSPGAIAFDISAADLKSGKSHYEQIYERSLRAVLNAKGAFDQAGKMTRLLRSQEHQVDSSNAAIVDQESAFTKQLIDLYGTPYSGSIGAGKTYAQGYSGPDTAQWFVIDRPTELVNTSAPVSVSLRVPIGIRSFSDFDVDAVTAAYNADLSDGAITVSKTVTVTPNQFVQFADVWRSGGEPLGARSVTGTLQQSLLDTQQAYAAFRSGADQLLAKQEQFRRRAALYAELVSTHTAALAAQDAADGRIESLTSTAADLRAQAKREELAGAFIGNLASSLAEFLPKVMGLSVDALAPGRGSILLAGALTSNILSTVSAVKYADADKKDLETPVIQGDTDTMVAAFGFTYQQAQVAYEYELLYRELLNHHYEINRLATSLQRATERMRNVMADGLRVLEDRTIFRQRAAALIQGYRTKDVTFRTFRNEALEQYRSLFDLASRYTYLAAKSYDYETGLLGSAAGQDVLNKIVAARSLGDLAGGVPQATVSTLGDAGLAGTMARIQADWSVAKGRLGINNPDQNGTLFSLRRELFRLLDDPTRTDDEAAWQQTLEQHIVSNLLSDPDIATYCRNLRKPDGSAVPGIVIPFRTTITHGQNFFGLPLVGGDNAFSPSNYATKIYSVGMVLRGYVGMNPYSIGVVNAGTPASNDPKALSASPYLYLIPTGTDTMLSPPLGDTGAVREWKVADQALPLPFNLGATAFSTSQFYNANGTLSEQPWILRKHQAFRPVSDPAFFYSSIPAEFTNSRLVGRSAWNGGWKIVIPAYSLLASEQDGLNRFVSSVKDIELFLRTYSHSGN